MSASNRKPCCTMSFRGHQDVGFGLKLLFTRQVYNKLSAADKASLFTCGGLYQKGPFWWKQVFRLCQLGYRRLDASTHRLYLKREFMNNIIPIFTLSTAVTCKDIKTDSFSILHMAPLSLDIYEKELTPNKLDFSYAARKRSVTNGKGDPLHHRPEHRVVRNSVRTHTCFRGRMGYMCDGLEPRWLPSPLSEDVQYNICRQLHVAKTRISHHNFGIFSKCKNTSKQSSASSSMHEAMWQMRPGINTVAFRHRLCSMCCHLMEYAGGDQYVFRKLVCRTPYDKIMLKELKELIVWFWSMHAKEMQASHPSVFLMHRDNRHKHIVVTGDIHGNIHSLVRIVCRLVQRGYMSKEFVVRSDVLWVFLGDYVDYGAYGTEVLWVLLCLSLINPHNVVLLGGNHEDLDQNELLYGHRDTFKKEIMSRFGKTAWDDMTIHMERLHTTLPKGLILYDKTSNTEFHFSHGCISPYLYKNGNTINQITWSDVHQQNSNATSGRGEGIKVYGTAVLEELLRCDCCEMTNVRRNQQ